MRPSASTKIDAVFAQLASHPVPSTLCSGRSHGVDVLTAALDPEFGNGPSRFESQDGMMTPLNMSGSEPHANCTRLSCLSRLLAQGAFLTVPRGI